MPVLRVSMVSKKARKSTSPGVREKQRKVQVLMREYNALVREYNALSKKDRQTAMKKTAAGEAAAKRLVRKYNQVAAKGRALERAAVTYANAKKKR